MRSWLIGLPVLTACLCPAFSQEITTVTVEQFEANVSAYKSRLVRISHMQCVSDQGYSCSVQNGDKVVLLFNVRHMGTRTTLQASNRLEGPCRDPARAAAADCRFDVEFMLVGFSKGRIFNGAGIVTIVIVQSSIIELFAPTD